MTDADLTYGAKTLIGDRNWQNAGLRETVLVLLFGKRETYEHLGVRCTIRWWQGCPYLTAIREARS